MEIVAAILILLFSVIFHEVAHGLMAFRLGDPTAKYAGRLTLNPISHIDLFGSIIMPAALFYMRSLGIPVPIIGAAKPVPVNYNNLGNIKRDMFLVSIVGPLTNLLLAALAAAVLRLTPGISENGLNLLLETISLNVALFVFNMLPIPPLDGSKVLASILGYLDHNLMYRILDLERFGFIILIVFLMVPNFFSSILLPPIIKIMEFLVGSPTPLMF